MVEIGVIYSRVPDKKIAKKITDIILKHRLAVSVSMIDNVSTQFIWEDEICKEKDVLLMIRTKRSNYAKIKLLIEDMNPYTVSEVLTLPIVECSEEYAKWIQKEVK